MRKSLVVRVVSARRFVPDRVLKTRGGGLSVVSVGQSRLRNLASDMFSRKVAGFIRELKNRDTGREADGRTDKTGQHGQDDGKDIS